MTEEEAAMVVPGDELWLWHVRSGDPCCVTHLVARSPSRYRPKLIIHKYWIDVVDEDGRRLSYPICYLFRSREEAERHSMVEAMKSP
jgi:hypothetical protein